MPPLADNSYGPPQGVPIPAHDLRINGSNGAAGSNGNISYTESGSHANGLYGANPAPGWSSHVGPTHKAPPPVATQLVVPNELSDGPVTLTCFHCQHHMTTRTKAGPSTLTWALCTCLCIFGCIPCCVIPFCLSRYNVTEHYCSNCNTLLGKYKGWKKSS